jgi:hypothetical protein
MPPQRSGPERHVQSKASRPRRPRDSRRNPRERPRFRWQQQALGLRLFAGELSGPSDRFGRFAAFLAEGLFAMLAKPHFAEDAFALQLPLSRLQSLVDVVISNENLHATSGPRRMILLCMVPE